MANELATKDTAAQIMERVLMAGDLKSLQPKDRVRYYNEVCTSVGLNPLTTPFEYITLNGKLTLYAKKSCTDQLRSIHGVSITIASREKQGDIYIVSARATNAAGRVDEDVGAVTVGNLKGDALCNAMMKAETKAKRRVTLSICGLGMLDETEIATVPDAKVVPIEQVHNTTATDDQPAPADTGSQIESQFIDTPAAAPAEKGSAYKKVFIDAIGKVLAKRLNVDEAATMKRAMSALWKQHTMTPDDVSPEVGGRLIQAIGEGKFDVPLTQTEAA